MLEFLRKVPFFSRLKAAELRQVYNISQVKEFGPGEIIFSKSETADRMFIVLAGRVKIFSPSRGKKRKTFAYLLPGDFFGEMALIEGQVRSASAEAVDYSKLLVVTKKAFQNLLTSDPKLALFMLRAVSERLRMANAEIENLLFRNILGRVAKTLHDLARRGQKVRGGVLLKDHYTQQELADLVGTTREPLTRALSALRRVQLVEGQGGRYFIKDAEKLAALCLLEP